MAIDLDALEALAAASAEPLATLDPGIHHLDGAPEEVARYLLTLDTINFGSGWFPTLRKRAGRSGYATVASRPARALPRRGTLEQRAAARARHRDGRARRSGRPPTTS